MTRIRLLRLEFVRLWFACFDMGLSTFVGLIWLVFAVVETTEQFNYLSPRTTAFWYVIYLNHMDYMRYAIYVFFHCARQK